MLNRKLRENGPCLHEYDCVSTQKRSDFGRPRATVRTSGVGVGIKRHTSIIAAESTAKIQFNYLNYKYRKPHVK